MITTVYLHFKGSITRASCPAKRVELGHGSDLILKMNITYMNKIANKLCFMFQHTLQ